MPHSAFYIVEEFLRSRDAQVRKNALTALAVLERDEDTIERLANAALNDADEGVRHRAMAEIAALPDVVLPRAVKVLQDALADQSRRQPAYALLGYLKSLGRALPKPGSFLSPPSRLRLAWAMNKYTYPVRKWAFRLRTWKPALLGSTLCLIVVLISFSEAINWDNKAYTGVSLFIPMLAVIACAFAAQHTTPFNLYFDRPAAFTVEIGGAILYTMATEILLLFLSIAFERDPDGNEGLLALVIGLPFAVGLTRAATLLSYGVLKHRWTNIVFQSMVGMATMFLLLVALNFIFWKINPVVGELREGYFELNHLYQMMEAFWLALLPLGIGLALSFTLIDNNSPLKRTGAGRLNRYFSYIIILLAVIPLPLIVFTNRHDDSQRGVNINPTFEWLSGRVSSIKKPAEGSSDAPVPER